MPAPPTPSDIRWVEHAPREQEAVDREPFQSWTLPDGTAWTYFFRHGQDYLLRFPELADFTVSIDGLTVESWPAPGTSQATVLQLYLNQVVPLARSRQGTLVLHASAIELDGQALAFIGESGRGKSTLAAAFATSEWRFLTDDGLHLEWVNGKPVVVPSHPSIRLWEDSQEALVGTLADMAPAVDYTRKSRFLAGTHLSFCDQPCPLAGVFLLGPGTATDVSIRAAKPAEAMMEMVRNSFVLDIAEHELLAQHFTDIGAIADLPIHYHLDYPRRFDALPAVRAAIVAHLSKAHVST